MFEHDFSLFHPILAQDDGPPLASQGGRTTTPTEPGNGDGGGGGNTAPPGSLFGGDGSFLFIIIIVIGAFMLISILGQRKEKKKRQDLLESIKKHDRVQTIGGVIGSVVELKPEEVVLKVDESSNTRMTFSRSAIQQVLTEKTEENKTATQTE